MAACLYLPYRHEWYWSSCLTLSIFFSLKETGQIRTWISSDIVLSQNHHLTLRLTGQELRLDQNWPFCLPPSVLQQRNWPDVNNTAGVSVGTGACPRRYAGRWNIWRGCIQWSSWRRGMATEWWREPYGLAPWSETCSRSWQPRRGSRLWENLNWSSQQSEIKRADEKMKEQGGQEKTE